MQVCISLHAVTLERRYGPSRLLINDDDLAPDNDASTPPIRFLQAGRPSCRPSKCKSTEQKNKTNKHKSSYLTSQSLKVSVRNHEDWFTTAEFFCTYCDTPILDVSTDFQPMGLLTTVYQYWKSIPLPISIPLQKNTKDWSRTHIINTVPETMPDNCLVSNVGCEVYWCIEQHCR